MDQAFLPVKECQNLLIYLYIYNVVNLPIVRSLCEFTIVRSRLSLSHQSVNIYIHINKLYYTQISYSLKFINYAAE